MPTSPRTFPTLHIVDHPLVRHKITLLRDRATPTKQFKELVDEIAMLMATRNLALDPVPVDTPLETTSGWSVRGKKLTLVPILRAGLGMVEGILHLIPSARVGHIGLYRDPKTLQAVEYYFKMPQDMQERDVVVVDPMLATGNSAVAAIDRVKALKPKSIKFMCLLTCPEGVRTLHKAHPDVAIYTAAVDRQLNDHGYILPGLGDAGDRIFGTQ